MWEDLFWNNVEHINDLYYMREVSVCVCVLVRVCVCVCVCVCVSAPC